MEHRVNSEIFLKQISQTYSHKLYDLIQSNQKSKLLYWCPDLKQTYKDLNSTQFHIDDANSKFSKDGSPDLLIFLNHQLSGLISLSPLYEEGSASEVGYWLADNFTGKGVISKCFPFILEYAKNKLNLSKLDISTSITNIRSQKIPIKFNFSKGRIIKEVEIINGKKVDHILWTLNL